MSRRRYRATTVRRTAAALTLLALLALPAAALADGDPASDVLLVDNVFFPYVPATSTKLQDELNGVTTAAAKSHEPIKIALIASRVDLGSIPELFAKPQQYADFLDQEISFTARQPLLVVMADGYGTQGLSGAATAAVAASRKPSGGTSDDLAQAALTEIAKITAADGHPLLDVGSQTAPASGSSSTLVILAVLVILALAAAGGTIAVTMRRRA